MFLIFEDTPEKLKGEFAIKIFRCNTLIDEFSDHNLVVEAGRVRLAQLAAGLSNAHITHIGVGSGSTEESPADLLLENQILIPITTASVTGRDAKFDFVIDQHQANGLSIREFGLFCADGTMFSHRVRFKFNDDGTKKVLQIDKENDILIQGYWILHF